MQPLLLEDGNKDILTLPGYSPLVPEATYVLFLAKSEYGKSENQEYAWNIISMNHGKYNIDGKDPLEDVFSDAKQLKLQKSVIKKYGIDH
ncbi:hypothetical protein [Lentibacillus saliphilus]|uniref:hypothetical protein n=1 Tax=Lentibacillus saliphilus TaxID=2737028 RepID=UPI001C2F4328|nr:hypothetical protein [Lentibacillus saliphilus]